MMGKAERLLRSMKRNTPQVTPIATEMVLPNLSGDHSAGSVGTPTKDIDIANKKYVDDNLHDAVTVVDGTTINFTLNGQQITAETIDAQINHDALNNFAANEHFTVASIDHTAILNIGTNTHAEIDTAVTASTNHIADNTQAHSDYLKNDAADVGVGLTLTGDNSSADTAYVGMVLYGTDATPPAASGFPIGTRYVQYTA